MEGPKSSLDKGAHVTEKKSNIECVRRIGCQRTKNVVSEHFRFRKWTGSCLGYKPAMSILRVRHPLSLVFCVMFCFATDPLVLPIVVVLSINNLQLKLVVE